MHHFKKLPYNRNVTKAIQKCLNKHVRLPNDVKEYIFFPFFKPSKLFEQWNRSQKKIKQNIVDKLLKHN